jgi:phage replication O-like protein O
MASPQKENGFTPIANEILEALARYPLNGTQWRILMVIFRYTYGFNRKTHGLSETFISKATGIHRKQIQRELNGLIACKIVSVIDNATFNSPRKLAFNKDHSIWVVTNKLPGSEKEDTANQLPGSQLEAHTGSELVPSPGSELAPQERNNIKKIRNKSICPFSEIQNLFNTICKSLPAVQKMTDSRKEKLSKRWIEMPGLNEWSRLFTIVECTPFLKGQNDRGWKASFDWLIRNDTNIVGVLEGKYGNKPMGQDKYQNIIT